MGTIHYFTPFALDKNLGRAYNECMEMIGEDDWGCFVDADVMFLTSNYGQIIADVVEKFPDTGMFTCYTNRVGNKQQLLRGKMHNSPDILYHRRLAKNQQKKYGSQVRPLKNFISGHLMLMSKKVWNDFKFLEKGILGVDNHMSSRLLKAGLPLYIMKGIYVFHYYRLAEGHKYKKHLR